MHRPVTLIVVRAHSLWVIIDHNGMAIQLSERADA